MQGSAGQMDEDGRALVQAGLEPAAHRAAVAGCAGCCCCRCCCVLVSVLQVLVLRFVDPPFSAFMAGRQLSAWAHGDWKSGVAYDWRDLDRMAPSLPLALVAAEDQNFADALRLRLQGDREGAPQATPRGRKLRGASTISQQVAKNLFLWSGRSWVRKGIEAWYTVLIETLWPKRRILEMYANIAEFGDGIYGAQAAARTFFRKDASRLTPAECARLAAVLPSPQALRRRAAGPVRAAPQQRDPAPDAPSGRRRLPAVRDH